MDTDDERIDFSTLDPSRNELRWRRTVDALVVKAIAERRRRLTVEHQLLRWARPVLAVAAGLCIVAWAAGLLSGSPQPASQQATANHPALTWSSWAANNQIPEPSDLVAMVGGN
jgi:TRAP-type C4-dicarboxylate transport system permease small subunit